MKHLSGALSIIALFIVAVAGIALYQLWDTILWAAQTALTAVIIAAAVLSVVTAIALIWRVWDWLMDMVANSRYDRQLKRIELEKAQAEANRARRDSDIYVITAKFDEQIHILTDGHWRPAHLDARTYANGPVTHRLASDEEAAAWHVWQATHGCRSPDLPALPEPTAALPPPLLPKLIKAQRLFIAGGSDAGKTTLAKHIIAGRLDHSKVVIIDPHAPSKILGIDCIGAGRNYEAIGNALESLCELMSHRYDDIKHGLASYGQHDLVSVFIDEWTGIRENIQNAGDLLKVLLIESRKVNIHLTILTHSLTVDTLGIDAQIRASATLVQLHGGNDSEERRAFILPNAKVLPDGKKAQPVEYALPGPFAGYVKTPAQVVKVLPDARVLRAQRMEAEGATATAIAREFFGVSRPNGGQIKQVRELLERATGERLIGEAAKV